MLVLYDKPIIKQLTVVPNHHGSRSPSDAGLDILAPRNMLIQELQQVVAFFLLEADNISSELRVDKKSLLASGGMGPHNWVDGPVYCQSREHVN
jgi:hypothetical protein